MKIRRMDVLTRQLQRATANRWNHRTGAGPMHLVSRCLPTAGASTATRAAAAAGETAAAA